MTSFTFVRYLSTPINSYRCEFKLYLMGQTKFVGSRLWNFIEWSTPYIYSRELARCLKYRMASVLIDRSCLWCGNLKSGIYINYYIKTVVWYSSIVRCMYKMLRFLCAPIFNFSSFCVPRLILYRNEYSDSCMRFFFQSRHAKPCVWFNLITIFHFTMRSVRTAPSLHDCPCIEVRPLLLYTESEPNQKRLSHVLQNLFIDLLLCPFSRWFFNLSTGASVIFLY